MKLYDLSTELSAARDAMSKMLEDGDDQQGVDYNTLVYNTLVYNTLSALTLSVKEEALQVASWIKNEEASEAALDAEIKRLQGRKASKTKLIKSLRYYILDAMTASKTDKIKSELFTLSVRDNKGSLVIDSEDLIPAQYKERLPSLRKAAIKSALAEGKSVPGARIEKNRSLSIR